MKKWLCLIICCCLLLPAVAACDSGGGNTDPDPTPDPTPAPAKTVYVLDFADGKSDFLAMNTGAPGTDIDSEMAVVDLDGAKALRLTAPNGRALRLGINIGGLLGNRITDVRNIVFDVYAGYPDGNFSAVSGDIVALSGESEIASTKWQIYLATRNPSTTTMELGPNVIFSAGEANLIEFSCKTNGPADRGETPAHIYIKSVTFFDVNNEAISLNTEAQFESPEGWGETIVLGGWALPIPPPVDHIAENRRPAADDWQTWLTPGVDGSDYDYMPWEKIAVSFGISFKIDEKPESFGLVVFGAFNGWSSNKWDSDFSDNWADGILTIMWDDYGFDTSEITEDQSAVKIAYHSAWGETEVSSASLLVDEDS